MTGTGDGGHDTANDRTLEVIPVPTTRTVGTLSRYSLTKPMKISLGGESGGVGGYCFPLQPFDRDICNEKATHGCSFSVAPHKHKLYCSL